jgi:hypothetical protein
MAKTTVNEITGMVLEGTLIRHLGEEKASRVTWHVRKGWKDAKFRKLFEAHGNDVSVHVDVSVTVEDLQKLFEIMPDIIQACASILRDSSHARKVGM